MSWRGGSGRNVDHLTCSERILRVNRRNLVHASKLKLRYDEFDRQCSKNVSKIASEIYAIYFEEQLPREREMVERGLLEPRTRMLPIKNSNRRMGLGGKFTDERYIEQMTSEFEKVLRQNSLPEDAIKREVGLLLRSDIDTVVKASDAYRQQTQQPKSAATSASNSRASTARGCNSSYSRSASAGERRKGSTVLPAVTLAGPAVEKEEAGFLGEWRPQAFRIKTPRILHADWVSEKNRKEKMAEQSQRSYQHLMERLTAKNHEQIEKLYMDSRMTSLSP